MIAAIALPAKDRPRRSIGVLEEMGQLPEPVRRQVGLRL